MNRRTRGLIKSPSRRAEHFHKYLKPGALARIRDSRISARSHRINSLFQISLDWASLPSSPSPSDGQALVNSGEGIPCFGGRIYGPQCPQRKKLMAAKSVSFISADPASDLPDSIIESFSNDILVAN